ncbi:ATP-dependent DNA ligase [Actinomadura alba]|uniref:ATP-dependent DNA ligase n=1 Tax=Actinomadura alba TaxID=406431 RepID=A0ABR7M1T1_9ACTN|nr:ATP-dependent DNA ligase [Actinomadura alba]MBC6470996.1 ATP-dependent DNA ligase [Actinomadura alba]
MYLRCPVEPMLARSIDHLPAPEELRGGSRYEPKWDGFRAIGRIDKRHGVHLVSRRGTRLNEAFPELVAALYEELPAATVIDGEIIRWGAGGRLDFAALQERLIAGSRVPELVRTQPCHLIVFDVMIVGGEDLVRRPFAQRRQVLEDLFTSVPPASPLVATMHTDNADEARIWVEALSTQGIEGLIIKAAGDPYLPGKRRWLKLKTRHTIDVIVGGVTGSPSRPRDLIVGRIDPASGGLRVVGRTTAVPPAAHAALAAALTPAGDEHPWPAELPSGWAGGMYGSPPMQYVRVRPDVVVEVSVDLAIDRGRLRHPARFHRLRSDLRPDDVPAGLALT